MFQSASLIALAMLCAAAQAQTIKKVPITPTSPVSGVEMFKQYCAACHGADAKGNGPAANALKTAPSDLTLMSQRNGGKFPHAQVATVIRGDTALEAHGSQEMPVSGQLFKTGLGNRPESEVQMRIVNLTSYIQSLQVK